MRLRPLDRKVLRDVWRTRWQIMAVALLIACGVSVAVMSFSAQRALAEAQRRYYADTRFADVFARVRRAPLSVARELGRIDGVLAVDVRIAAAGLMDVPGLERPAVAHLISLPADEGLALNRIRLVEGRMPDPAHRDEVVALRTFIEAAHLRIGERLTAVIAGRAFSFTIVGAALSPEYVYVPAPESFMPDDAHQGVFWAPRATVERAADMTGAFNTAALALAPGTSPDAVVAALDRILAPYGGRAAYARADQPSHAFLVAELKELSTSASILPPIFLVIAAGLVHMVVSRMVEAEREQVGLLKAFGYGDWAAARPYLRLAAVIGLLGVAAGGLAGASLAAAIVAQYGRYFRFPVLEVSFHWPAFVAAAAVAVAAALAGSLMAVLRAARLSPALAMQPPQPVAYRRGVFDRLLERTRIDQATRLVLRRVGRFPGRAALGVVGLATSLSLLIGTQFLFDSLDQIIDQAYFRARRATDTVAFEEARGIEVIGAVKRMPGVVAAEPVRIVAARLKAEGRTKLTRVVGLAPEATLERPLDGWGRPVPIKGRGLVLSEALAARLGLAPGDPVWVEVIDGRGPEALLTVSGLSRDYSGFSAYMDRRELNRLMGEGDVATGADLISAGDRRADFYRALEAAPGVVGAASRDETVASWRLAMAEAFRVTNSFYVGFAGAIAFGVAYNMVRIAYAERSRDLATLQVLGFGAAECAYVLAGELALLALAAAPLGVAGGIALAHGLVAAYSREEVRLPAVISARSFGLSALAYMIAVMVGGGLVVRRVWSMDLVPVLKTRE